MTVEFGEAVSALANSLVAARHALDTATADLAAVYEADEHLRSLPVPAFALAEARFDVPYVVDSVEEIRPPRLELVRRPVVAIGERELASLLRGAPEDTGARLRRLVEQHERMRDLYDRAREDPEVFRDEPIPDVERLSRADLAALTASASAPAREQLLAVVRDVQELQKALRTAAQKSKPRQRLFIRLDAESLAGVPPEQIQRAALTFRDVQKATVDVGGERVVVPD
ncbi:hypothetical protein [Blastococcus brunescens]|uniref:Endonuclease MutS2 n=1 Tax=Blastococcus brunescens TaxID=1564165 RepID=A0ABZ1B5Z9_9ACTN|nr:hypothetical protein [Blastococcus sp. BMG 8361]WRL66234.1 hypothetical protein U6N30_12615 [Blastococcus sp. BMG 8361]